MAEGRYTRIKSIFWHDEKTRLWDDETRYLALYLLTSPHNNILGCHVLPKLYICADLGWDMERLDKAFGKLLEDAFIKYDETNNLLLIVNYLKHNPIENGNQAKGAEKQLAELPKSPLLQYLKQYIKQLDKPFLKQLLERLPEPNGKPVTVTVTVTETVTTTPPTPPDDSAEDFNPEELEDSSRQVFATFEQELGQPLSSFKVEQINNWLKEFSPEMVIQALKIAILGNNRSFKYIDGILLKWKAEGVKTVADAEERERKFQEAKLIRAGPGNRKSTADQNAQVLEAVFGAEA